MATKTVCEIKAAYSSIVAMKTEPTRDINMRDYSTWEWKGLNRAQLYWFVNRMGADSETKKWTYTLASHKIYLVLAQYRWTLRKPSSFHFMSHKRLSLLSSARSLAILTTPAPSSDTHKRLQIPCCWQNVFWPLLMYLLWAMPFATCDSIYVCCCVVYIQMVTKAALYWPL